MERQFNTVLLERVVSCNRVAISTGSRYDILSVVANKIAPSPIEEKTLSRFAKLRSINVGIYPFATHDMNQYKNMMNSAKTDSRETERDLLARCVAAARQKISIADDKREANVFRLAAMVVRSRFPSDYVNLTAASDRYFAAHPEDKLPSVEVVRNGWIASLPRLRDMLSSRLRGQ